MEIRKDFITLPTEIPLIKAGIEEDMFKDLCQSILAEINPKTKYQYTGISELVFNWLNDNQRKGLFLWGGCGIGKTFLARYVIPYVLRCMGKAPTIINAIDLPQSLSLVRNNSIHYYIIDDVGTEKPLNDFGVKTEVFAELMYRAETDGKLVIITTNKDSDGIVERYGERVYSRIKGLCLNNGVDDANGTDFRIKTA